MDAKSNASDKHVDFRTSDVALDGSAVRHCLVGGVAIACRSMVSTTRMDSRGHSGVWDSVFHPGFVRVARRSAGLLAGGRLGVATGADTASLRLSALANQARRLEPADLPRRIAMA